MKTFNKIVGGTIIAQFVIGLAAAIRMLVFPDKYAKFCAKLSEKMEEAMHEE